MGEEHKQALEEKKENPISSNPIPRFFSPDAKLYPFSKVTSPENFTEIYGEDRHTFLKLQKEIKNLAETSEDYKAEYEDSYIFDLTSSPSLPNVNAFAKFLDRFAKLLEQQLFAEDIFAVNCAHILSAIEHYKNSIIKPRIDALQEDPILGPLYETIGEKVLHTLSKMETLACLPMNSTLDKISPERAYGIRLEAPIEIPEVKSDYFKPK